jgi:threonyl-tRNA synthetase
MVVYGGREAETGRLSVRRHGVGEMGSMTLEELVTRIEIEGTAEPGP